MLIRRQPGSADPAHRHVGLEAVFVLQGGYRDAASVHLAGDYLVNLPGLTRHPVALGGPEDCIMLAVAHQGIELIERRRATGRNKIYLVLPSPVARHLF